MQDLGTSLNRIIVTLGGTDTYGVTLKVVAWLNCEGRKATVILGPGFSHKEELENSLGPNIELKENVPSLVQEFYDYDLAIIGAGITAFEAAAAGLPTITIANEEFEIGNAEYLQELGCTIFAGHHNDINFDCFNTDIALAKMSQAGLDNVTTKGAELVSHELLKL